MPSVFPSTFEINENVLFIDVFLLNFTHLNLSGTMLTKQCYATVITFCDQAKGQLCEIGQLPSVLV